MAVNSTKVQSNMVLKFKTGTDENGNDVIKSQRFSKIKVNAVDDAVLNAGAGLAGLLRYPDAEVVREDISVLTQE